MDSSPTFTVRARGPLAIFTRPELKVERVSYPVMTPSAARGLLEAILWKPAIRWRIERIKVLNEIKFTAFRRNEINNKAVAPKASVIKEGGAMTPYYADEDRAQRNTVALKDVDYVIEAHFEMTANAGPEENLKKFTEMFLRRLEKGQHFHHPYLGCRECAADVTIAEHAATPIESNEDLGIMLWDIDFGKNNRPRFFHARLRDGVLEVPMNPDATLQSSLTGGAS
ncbi:MAG: type I-C CRISPR-associated protein Cas5 [Candidatus Hydrogenedentes bacterium]|nr:type I-C CRISPR-associated protein Cas5 [Candidatus Hydrogenedentota bacterium]